ncbi:MAG: metalloregulator ArsR/SmtB family transcription factor [Candidatus Omnitrophica bacterium]|nr:metalloregulator ArsR/SmtB family transcription factor [Candidatus Omnitrophota bacterium]
MTNSKNPERVFKALANSVRLEIIQLLSRRQFCVKALVSMMNISQAAVSQHLKILENAGLVKKKKEGYWVHYTLAPEELENSCVFLNKLLPRRELKINAERKKEKMRKGQRS